MNAFMGGKWHVLILTATEKLNLKPLTIIISDWGHPVVLSNTNIKYILLYSFGTQQIVLSSIYKSGNMFQLIQQSTGQFINHTEGTFSRCARCGIPNVQKSYDNKRSYVL